MRPLSDARILLQFARGQRGKGGHSERLQRFYAPQAARYDAFRDGMLHGRQTLIDALAPPPGARVIELGGGTGRNLDFLGPRMLSLEYVEIVDLCPALLEEAQKRARRWPDVARVIHADACEYRPPHPVDCVYFSYSLSMIPDWRVALSNATRMLRPGGLLGIVDFYVSRADPPPGFVKHGPLTRAIWPRWFRHDGVRLDPEHLHTAGQLTDAVALSERRGALPYLAGVTVPYYLYVGRKRGTCDGA